MDNQVDQNLGILIICISWTFLLFYFLTTKKLFSIISDQMSAQLARLRMWGSALGDEVDDQNRMLDRIHTKTERNDAVVRSQEGQMRKLLG